MNSVSLLEAIAQCRPGGVPDDTLLQLLAAAIEAHAAREVGKVWDDAHKLRAYYLIQKNVFQFRPDVYEDPLRSILPWMSQLFKCSYVGLESRRRKRI